MMDIAMKKNIFSHLLPSFLYSIARELLKFAIPPLYGKQGPIIITFPVQNLNSFLFGNYFDPDISRDKLSYKSR